MNKATVSLWYNGNAEDAAKFYVKIFKGAKIKKVTYYPKDMPEVGGKGVAVYWKMLGLDVVGINGGPDFQLTPAFSLTMSCKTQKEVDTYWTKLLADGGKEMACGWLTDKFGLTWQIVPEVLPKYLSDKNQAKASATMQAMMKMIKLDIKTLKAAYNNAGKK